MLSDLLTTGGIKHKDTPLILVGPFTGYFLTLFSVFQKILNFIFLGKQFKRARYKQR
jgi:hypothetical protein